mmetsp:Transcript_14363/g.35550  ORF Transcript_14363/g.35550 Transcript_14363/m.35550 type:complete len:203 (-) Transcript_14363:256-864(-)
MLNVLFSPTNTPSALSNASSGAPASAARRSVLTAALAKSKRTSSSSTDVPLTPLMVVGTPSAWRSERNTSLPSSSVCALAPAAASSVSRSGVMALSTPSDTDGGAKMLLSRSASAVARSASLTPCSRDDATVICTAARTLAVRRSALQPDDTASTSKLSSPNSARSAAPVSATSDAANAYCSDFEHDFEYGRLHSITCEYLE